MRRMAGLRRLQQLQSVPFSRLFDKYSVILIKNPPFSCLTDILVDLIKIIEQSQKKLEMFYSPSKEFVRFSTYRTEEIKALRERIHKEKVTSEQIESTQLRLERLRQDYEQLQTEPCSELKEVFHNSERAIEDLLKQKSLSEKELAYTKQQFEKLEKRRIQLQDRGAQLQEQLRAQNSEKDKLVEVKVERQQKIVQMEEEYNSNKKEIAQLEGLRKEVSEAENGLVEKKEEYKMAWTKSQSEKEELKSKIKQEEQVIESLKNKWDASEKEAEHQRLWVKHIKLTQDLYQERIGAYNTAQATSGDDDWLLQQQKLLSASLGIIRKAVEEEASRVAEVDQQKRKSVETIQAKIAQNIETRGKLEQRIETVKVNLRLLREKNESLRIKMNSIFKNDSELVKLISSKKAYPHVRGEVVEIVKKSAIQPMGSKQNIPLTATKIEKGPEEIITPRAFSEINRLV